MAVFAPPTTAEISVKRIRTGRSIVVSAFIVVERLGTNGRVVAAQVVQKCIITKERIVAGVATFLTNGLRLRRKDNGD